MAGAAVARQEAQLRQPGAPHCHKAGRVDSRTRAHVRPLQLCQCVW
jgi:hypothetical protein